jgi:hypothetical protein
MDIGVSIARGRAGEHSGQPDASRVRRRAGADLLGYEAMERVIPAALALGMVATACNKDRPLPPATDWQTPEVAPTEPQRSTRLARPQSMGGMRSNPHGDPSDPHAGLDMNDPHAGLDMNDPHAGLDMNDPHAGLDMGGGGPDVTQLGLTPPDPNRRIDPTQRVAGVITVDPKVGDRAKPGTSVFLVVKRAGADGAPGQTLAVDKLTWGKDGLSFELTDANAMLAGTALSGEVIVIARYDQDSDALTKEPGDITGQVRVKIPAERVKLQLDTVLP